MIRIVNLRGYTPKQGEVLVRVDRSNKILGNPFVMKDESERDLVCDRYDVWIMERWNRRDPVLMGELQRIRSIADRSDVALACWCVPRRCHAMTVKRLIESL